jgi:hypothetical protein
VLFYEAAYVFFGPSLVAVWSIAVVMHVYIVCIFSVHKTKILGLYTKKYNTTIFHNTKV